MKKLSSICVLLVFLGLDILAQDPYRVTFLSDDANEGTIFFENTIKAEIRVLLANKLDVEFTSIRTSVNSDSLKKAIQKVYASSANVLIGLGLNGCNEIAKSPVHPIPTILTFILDNEFQKIPMTAEGTSGKKNLVYIQSPFDIARDLRTLYEITPYQKLCVINAGSIEDDNFDEIILEKNLSFSNAQFEEISIQQGENAKSILGRVPSDADAVYILPIFNHIPESEISNLLAGLSNRGLPTFSLLSSPMIELGGYAAYETDGNLQRIPRRVAINLMKIVDGQAPENLPVTMDNFTESLIINMKTAKATGLYPSWETLAKGILINVTENNHPDHALTLPSAISEGLQNNLGLKIADDGVQIIEKDVAVARSSYLPQINASASVVNIDENSVRNSFGTRGQFSTTATATFEQLILSEPVLANVAIQKLLLESERQSRKQNELDVIIDVANAYLGILQTLALVKLRNENVNVTRKNYDIAQAKEQVGYGGTSDVYRWQSELALDNVDLNTTQAQLQQARFGLNALLNRPIKEEFKLEDVDLADSILLVMDSRMFPLINNPGDLEVFADFLVKEAFSNLPELKQIEASRAAQERSLLSQKRAFYLPSLALSGQYDYPIDNSGYPEGVMPIEIKPSYSVSVGLQFPIFQGQSRRIQKDQTQIQIFQLDHQLANLRNNLELQVRSNLEIAGASFGNLELTRIAAEAAQKNFEIAQNSYEQGILNITSLIDAQNAYLSAKINATNAAYTFISDFLTVERAIGYFHFLATPQEQAGFFQRFIQFVTAK